MTNYNRKSFSVPMGAARISEENWERTFGKKLKPADEAELIPASPWKAIQCEPPGTERGLKFDDYNVVRSYPRRPSERETWEHRTPSGAGLFNQEEAEALVATLNGVPPRTKEAVPVSGVWVRTHEHQERDRLGFDVMKWTIIEVLVEIDGKWRCVQTHQVRQIDQTISEITENAGMRKAPEDHL